MRFGYAFMGVGLAIVKWPVLIQNAQSLPVMEGVVACLLIAMSLLAFLGLRYPVRMLPILLFSCSFVVIIPRRHPLAIHLAALRPTPGNAWH
jgi:hypothetical protein